MGKHFKGLGEQELRSRQWSQQDFHDFFKEEGGILNSSRFKAVEKAFKACEQLQNKPITEENAMKMVKANQELMKACREYAAGKTSGGERRLAVFEQLVAFQEAKNLDQIRDLRIVRDYQKQGKRFGDVASFEVPHVTLEGKAEVVGANVSQRIKLEVNGKKGFFTEENPLRKASDYYLDLLKETKEPELKALMGKNYAVFQKMTKTNTSMPKKMDYNVISSQITYSVEKAILEMDPKDPRRIRLEAQRENNSPSEIGTIIRAMEKNGDLYRPLKERTEIFRKAFEKNKKLNEWAADAEFYAGLPLPRQDMRLGELQNLTAKNYINELVMKLEQESRELDAAKPQEKKRLEAIQREKGNLEELRDNERALHAMGKKALEANAAGLAASVGEMDLDQNELTSRNIAMSRMAELLGMGGIIAHSRKMVVKTGDKEVSGCFMEYAEGIDPDAKDYDTLHKFSQVEFTPTASFNQDMSNIEILDYLCNQADRHGRNMFYKLTEPDEHGKRNIVGIQGIDNDLAFGNASRNLAKQGDLDEMFFVGREVAERIRKLDASAIDFALGDLIPENQRNLVKERLTKFQEHMKENMVEIDKDGWDLKKYPANMSNKEIEALDSQGKIYAKGVKSLEGAVKAKLGGYAAHKSAHLRSAVAGAKGELKRQEKELEELGEGMQAFYGEDHEKGVKAPEKESIREPISLKEIQERNKAAQSANIRPKLAFEKEVKEKKEPKKEAARPQPKKPAAGKKAASQPKPKEAARTQPSPPPRKPGFQAAQPKQAGSPQRVQTNFLALGGAGKGGGRTSMGQTPAQPQPQRQKEAGGLVR